MPRSGAEEPVGRAPAKPSAVEDDRRPASGSGAKRPGRQRRALAHGGDRRHARRAQRRAEAREQRDDDPERAARRRSSASRSTRPLFGSVKPTASKSVNSPSRARARGRARRSTRGRPSTSASTTIEPSTCRREAPSVRSVASSRVRCAIVIESELAITNAPTKSAITPKASRKSGGSEMNSFVSFASSVACAVAGPHLRARRAGSPGSRRRAAPARRPACAATRIWSSLPSLSKSRCAVGRSKPASVAPPIGRTEPNLTSPEIRSCSTGPSAWTPIRLPDCEVLLVRGRRRRSRPRSAFGQAPLDERQRVELAACVGSTLKPRFGAPPKTIALPSLPISCASPPTPPIAACDVGQRRAPPASSDSSKGGALRAGSVASRSNADFPVIVASVPS